MKSNKYYEIYYELSKRYLHWDNDVFTNRNKILPVLMFSEVKDHNGKLYFKVEYWAELSGRVLKNELIDYSLPADEIVCDIEEKMASYEWYDVAEYFRNAKEIWLDSPLGTFHLEESLGRVHMYFEVIPEEGQVDYFLKNGSHISTDTRFDVGISVDEPTSFDFAIRKDKKDTFKLRRNDQRKESIILTGTLNGYSIAMSCLNPKKNANLYNKFKIKQLSTGFRIKVIGDDINKIWLKVAWVKSTDGFFEETELALAQWIK